MQPTQHIANPLCFQREQQKASSRAGLDAELLTYHGIGIAQSPSVLAWAHRYRNTRHGTALPTAPIIQPPCAQPQQPHPTQQQQAVPRGHCCHLVAATRAGLAQPCLELWPPALCPGHLVTAPGSPPAWGHQCWGAGSSPGQELGIAAAQPRARPGSTVQHSLASPPREAHAGLTDRKPLTETCREELQAGVLFPLTGQT